MEQAGRQADLQAREHADRLVWDFLEERAVSGCSPRTLAWYRQKVGRFVGWVGVDPRTVGPGEVRAFLASLQASPECVHGYGRALRAFYRYLVREGVLDRSPMERVRLPRVPYRVPLGLRDDQWERFLGAIARGGFTGERNYLLFRVLLSTGLRLGEALGLRVQDYDQVRGLVRVWGKGARERVVVITDLDLRRALGRYVRRFGVREYLFPSREGGRLSGSWVNRLCHRYARAAGISERVYPHLMRHTYATRYIAEGGNAFWLQASLGHSTLAMTARYVHLATQMRLGGGQ